MTQPDFVLANKIKFNEQEALEIARKASTVFVAKGKKLLKFDDSSSDEDLAKVILGRSGTLRAPAIQVGDTLLVGYHAEGYAEIFD